MKKIIIGIGIPGSGKTTILKSFADKNQYIYICPDDIRQELTGDAKDQSKNAEVWNEARKRVLDQLNLKNSIVFDATFANQSQRIDFISFARESGAEKIEGIFVNTDLETSKERNKTRERQVPEHVLDNMHNQLTNFPPSVGDGFDSVFILNQNQELINVELKNGEKTLKKEYEKFNFR